MQSHQNKFCKELERCCSALKNHCFCLFFLFFFQPTLNILSASGIEASAANSTPHQSFRHRGFKLQALQSRRKVGKLISPQTHITQPDSVVTAIIPDTITTQWQPASSAWLCFALLIAYIDRCLNTLSVTDGTHNHCFTRMLLPFRLYTFHPPAG